MKRSEINAIMAEADQIFAAHGWKLPPFAHFTVKDWQDKGAECDEIRDCMLGWDITDFGGGDYQKKGLFMFTLRNGSFKDPKYRKPYAEKLMIVRENQYTPYHFHWSKMEDIINRGGGNLLVQVYNSTPREELSDTDVEIVLDGVKHVVPAGTVLRIEPGQSVTLTQGLYHQFWGEEGKGTVVVGEVSKTNDDTCDNRFLEPCGRFPAIEEDEPALYPLCNEYPAAK